jgi:hypothetical protein
MYRFTVTGTVLQNDFPFLRIVAVRCTALQLIEKFAKSEKPGLHQEPPSLKNRSFSTGDFKILKTVGEPKFRPKLTAQIIIHTFRGTVTYYVKTCMTYAIFCHHVRKAT